MYITVYDLHGFTLTSRTIYSDFYSTSISLVFHARLAYFFVHARRRHETTSNRYKNVPANTVGYRITCADKRDVVSKKKKKRKKNDETDRV